MHKNKKRRGFTLIELLMVVAIVAILSSIILIGLNSSREKAAVGKYTSYAVQMHRLVADAVAAGYLDRGVANADSIAGSAYCFGPEDRCWGGQNTSSADLDNALTKLSDYPTGYNQDDVHSPFNSDYGVSIGMLGDNSAMRIRMYLLSGDPLFLSKTCQSMNWAVCHNDSCCVDVPLSTRMRGNNAGESGGIGSGL
jgi:prepilin-type N-terminal cleavage/methylation domain-containing protein